ncbi:unnamed protein product [Paramecium octaurelia]|uniref:Uncharacterized protein n=1 Tax=Paramecium octaurelia TaxID=43137 RepID=A0A8S1XMB4_PAROT|nr:unnamed protein product [Paramecium octaurelia]
MKSSTIEIEKNKRLKLNISELCSGPINNMTVINNSNVTLRRPIQYKQELLNFDKQTSILCYRQYHPQTQIAKLGFTVIISENLIIKVIKDYFWQQYYLTWIQWQFYLCISQLFDDLNIELIQSSENQLEFFIIQKEVQSILQTQQESVIQQSQCFQIFFINQEVV